MERRYKDHENHKHTLNFRILFVEDDTVTQLYIKKILESKNFIVETAQHGKESILMLDHNSYDIIIMDINMPIMNGIEATKIIRTSYSQEELPIIAMTANTMEKEIRIYDRIGINDLIPKPIDIQQLFSVLSKWINPDTIPYMHGNLSN